MPCSRCEDEDSAAGDGDEDVGGDEDGVGDGFQGNAKCLFNELASA